MNTFSEFIIEGGKVNHDNGTYVSVNLDKASAKKLDSFAATNGIKNPLNADDYHTTIIYSRKGVPEAEGYDINLPLTAQISGWEIFPTQDNKKALVGLINSTELKNHHDALKKMGATHDYPDYSPHITLSYDYDGEVPKNVPDFKVTFNKKTVEGLDPKWDSKKED